MKDVTVVSPGGMGCTFLRNTLNEYYKNKHKSKKRNINLTHNLQHRLKSGDKKHKFIYVYSDPLLSLISRAHRGLLVQAWMYHNVRHREKHDQRQVVVDLFDHVFAEGSKERSNIDYLMSVNTRKKEGMRHEYTILQAFVNIMQETSVDVFGMRKHFMSFFKEADNLDILFVDVCRDKNADKKINKFLNSNIKIRQQTRTSEKIVHLFKDALPNYSKLDKTLALKMYLHQASKNYYNV